MTLEEAEEVIANPHRYDDKTLRDAKRIYYKEEARKLDAKKASK